MGVYVGQVLRSHKGRGPDRVQVIKIAGDRVYLRYLNRRRSTDFDVPRWFLEHKSCGWVPQSSTLDRGKGDTPTRGGGAPPEGG
jgi:hypothetical protein